MVFSGYGLASAAVASKYYLKECGVMGCHAQFDHRRAGGRAGRRRGQAGVIVGLGSRKSDID